MKNRAKIFSYHGDNNVAASDQRRQPSPFAAIPGCEPAVCARCHGAGAAAIGSGGLDGISKGWPAILSGLKSMLESGTALVIPPSALDIEGLDRS